MNVINVYLKLLVSFIVFTVCIPVYSAPYWQINEPGIKGSITKTVNSISGFICTDDDPATGSITISNMDADENPISMTVSAAIIDDTNDSTKLKRVKFRKERCGGKRYISLFSALVNKHFRQGSIYTFQASENSEQINFTPKFVLLHRRFGLTYSVWHCPYSEKMDLNGSIEPNPYNITELLNNNVTTAWGPIGWHHWFDRPLDGYYCLGDSGTLTAAQQSLLKRHAVELSMAHINYISIDATNWPEAYMCKTFHADGSPSCTQDSPDEEFEMKAEFRDKVHWPVQRIVEQWSLLRAQGIKTPKLAIFAGISNNYKQKDIYLKKSIVRWLNDVYLPLVTESKMKYNYPGASKALLQIKINKKNYNRTRSGELISQLSDRFRKKFTWGFVSENTLPVDVRTYNNNLMGLYRIWSFTEDCESDSGNCNQRRTFNQSSISPAYHTGMATDEGYVGKDRGRQFHRQFSVTYDYSVTFLNVSNWNSWLAPRFCARNSKYGTVGSKIVNGEYFYPLDDTHYSDAASVICPAAAALPTGEILPEEDGLLDEDTPSEIDTSPTVNNTFMEWNGFANSPRFHDAITPYYSRDIEPNDIYYDCYLSFMRDSIIDAKRDHSGPILDIEKYNNSAVCNFDIPVETIEQGEEPPLGAVELEN